MKKLVSLAMILAICLSLCACGKSEAATACEELIGQIGEVSLDSESRIFAAENAYEALSDKEKEQIAESAQVLADSREKYNALVAEAERNARLEAVTALIDAIGEVTLDSESAIASAESAYSALSPDEQGMIRESGDKLAAAKAAYDAAVTETQVAQAVSSIDAIGAVTLESEAVVKAAREAYDALTDAAKALVTNYATLESAEAELADLKAAERDKILKTYTSKFEIDYDKVEGITWYMHKKMPDYIDVRSYIIPYIGVENNNVWICIRYNYTEDDWVFWKRLKIVSDGKSYSKSVGAFDTVRDNDGGVVWEWYDECLDYNQPLDSEELQMLRQIADSNETIIRFQGDDYSYDLTVTKTDKTIIADVLALYGALLES